MSAAPKFVIAARQDTDGGAMSVQLYRVSEAMRILGLSRSAIYRQFQSGRLRSVHQGRTRLVPASAIAEYVALLESEAAAQRAPSAVRHTA